MPLDVENAEELLYQASGHTLYQEEDLSYCYSDPGSINVSPSLTENEEDSDKTTDSPANLHDWDSGLGCTDGSIQVDDHSGHNTETEDLCMQVEGKPDPRDRSRKAGSDLDSVDFSTSDDLSDSGFCSISPEEYLRFQKMLECKCRQYQLRESNRQGQRIRQSPGLQREERHGNLNDEVPDRSAWYPRLPTLEEYPEGTLSLPCLKNEELPFSACMEPCPTKITSRECEENLQDKPMVNKQTQPPTTCIPSGEDQGIADRTLRRRSYLNCSQGDLQAEWLDYPLCAPNKSSWGDDGRCEDINQKGKMQFEKGRVASKKQNKSQLLKERALWLREERSGTTTDDDAQSEVKMGRHWSKAERRQHMLVAKEQKQRKELFLQGKMENLIRCGRTGQDGGSRNEQNIIELSHKKMMRKRSKKVLDNWITIQELLSHGTKSACGTTTYSPLLSVTTV